MKPKTDVVVKITTSRWGEWYTAGQVGVLMYDLKNGGSPKKGQKRGTGKYHVKLVLGKDGRRLNNPVIKEIPQQDFEMIQYGPIVRNKALQKHHGTCRTEV